MVKAKVPLILGWFWFRNFIKVYDILLDFKVVLILGWCLFSKT